MRPPKAALATKVVQRIFHTALVTSALVPIETNG